MYMIPIQLLFSGHSFWPRGWRPLATEMVMLVHVRNPHMELDAAQGGSYSRPPVIEKQESLTPSP